jgi:hypothetical protein
MRNYTTAGFAGSTKPPIQSKSYVFNAVGAVYEKPAPTLADYEKS